MSTMAATTATFGPIIDDMALIQSDGPGTQGSWYSYSDRTIANSEPPIITSAPGSVSPAEGASFPPSTPFPPTTTVTAATMLTLSDSATLGYRECSGGKESTWGAGFGLDLFDNAPDGGNSIPFNACAGEAGIFDDLPDAGAVGIPQPFDASAYTGFAFYGMSLTGANYNVDVQVDDDQTSPWGGQCGACIPAGTKCTTKTPPATQGCECSDNFLEQVTFTPTWKLFVIRWADKGFKVQNYSGEGLLTFHPNMMYNIHFQFSTTSGTALKPFDVEVALLQWVTN
jgi:hypothetical protein